MKTQIIPIMRQNEISIDVTSVFSDGRDALLEISEKDGAVNKWHITFLTLKKMYEAARKLKNEFQPKT